jgi:hypothetical protein
MNALGLFGSIGKNAFPAPTIVQMTAGNTANIDPALPLTVSAGSIGNRLVLGIALDNSGIVTSITQTGATWWKVPSSTFSDGVVSTEFWITEPLTTASGTSLSINLSPDARCCAVFMEVKGLAQVTRGVSPYLSTVFSPLITGTTGTGATLTTPNNRSYRGSNLFLAMFCQRGTSSTFSSPSSGYTLVSTSSTGGGGTDIRGGLCFDLNTLPVFQNTGITGDGSAWASSHMVLRGYSSIPNTKIRRIQFKQTATPTAVGSFNVVLDATPTNGNRLIALVSRNNQAESTGQQVTSISQTGTTWTYIGSNGVSSGVGTTTDLWISDPCSSASATASITLVAATKHSIATILEYEGLYNLAGTPVVGGAGEGASSTTWSSDSVGEISLIGPSAFNKQLPRGLQLYAHTVSHGSRTLTSTNSRNLTICSIGTGAPTGITQLITEHMTEESENQSPTTLSTAGTISASAQLYWTGAQVWSI